MNPLSSDARLLVETDTGERHLVGHLHPSSMRSCNRRWSLGETRQSRQGGERRRTLANDQAAMPRVQGVRRASTGTLVV